MEDGFYCSSCGEFHEGLPLDYGAKFPDYYFEIPVDEREERIYTTDNVCIVDNEFFFVRGVIEIPVLDSIDSFAWGVWCSLSEKSYKRMLEIWDDNNLEDEPPYFGWLNNYLTCYPNTINLKTNVHLRSNNQRPLIELEPTEHPLAVEQRNGITIKRVQEIAELIMHGK